MKKICILILSMCFSTSILLAQQAPVKLCAQVDVDGSTVEINVVVEDFVNISSFQFGVAWETANYTFVSIDNLNTETPASSSQVFDDIPDAISLIRTLWFDDTAVTPITHPDGTVLFTITLLLNDPNDMGLIGIAESNDFQIEFTNGNVEVINAEVDGTDCSTLAFNSLLNIDDLEFQELTVSPNPFDGKFVLSVDQALNGTVSLFSSTGKMIKNNIPVQGKEINLNFPDLLPGSYMLKYISKDNLTHGQIQLFKM